MLMTPDVQVRRENRLQSVGCAWQWGSIRAQAKASAAYTSST